MFRALTQPEAFRRSEAGVAAALRSFDDFSNALDELASASGLRARRSEEFRVISGHGTVNALCSFMPYHHNSLVDSYLQVGLYDGLPDIPGFDGLYGAGRELQTLRYSYELNSDGRCAWVGIDEDRAVFDPARLAANVVDLVARSK